MRIKGCLEFSLVCFHLKLFAKIKSLSWFLHIHRNQVYNISINNLTSKQVKENSEHPLAVSNPEEIWGHQFQLGVLAVHKSRALVWGSANLRL